MTTRRTYLDWNATAPLRPEAREATIAALSVCGNPSSVHAEGRTARRIVEDARVKVAALVGTSPSAVIFTGSATEANATVLAAGWDIVLLPGIEHDSVRAPAAASSAQAVEIATQRSGVVELAPVADVLQRAGGARRLIALQMANNETGVLQPVAEVVALAGMYGARTLTDAVQAAGRIAIDFDALGVDYLTVSAHKLGGPKGVGALVVREGADVPPLIRGGGQERYRRAGTEDVAAIAGFGAAAEAAQRELETHGTAPGLRDTLECAVLARTPGARIIGATAPRLWNTSAIALPDMAAETLVIRLDLAGIAVSAGAACSSGKVAASHVLTAMGVPPELARSAIRLSLGRTTRAEDIAAFLAAWDEIAGGAAIAA